MKRLSPSPLASSVASPLRLRTETDHAWLGYAKATMRSSPRRKPGWVAHLGVQRGSQVNRGETLFTLDDTQQQAARDQAAANLRRLKAQWRRLQANLDYTRKTE
jgi:multidrug resistance efflux pump